VKLYAVPDAMRSDPCCVNVSASIAGALALHVVRATGAGAGSVTHALTAGFLLPNPRRQGIKPIALLVEPRSHFNTRPEKH